MGSYKINSYCYIEPIEHEQSIQMIFLMGAFTDSDITVSQILEKNVEEFIKVLH